MMRRREETLVSAAFLGLVAAVLFMSADLGNIARRTPLAVALPTLALLLYQILRELLAAAAEGAFDEKTAAKKAAGRTRREGRVFGGLAVLLAAAYLLGLSTAVTAYVLCYLRYEAGESWRAALGVAAAVWAVLHGVFVIIMKLNLYDGRLLEWLVRSRQLWGAGLG